MGLPGRKKQNTFYGQTGSGWEWKQGVIRYRRDGVEGKSSERDGWNWGSFGEWCVNQCTGNFLEYMMTTLMRIPSKGRFGATIDHLLSPGEGYSARLGYIQLSSWPSAIKKK